LISVDGRGLFVSLKLVAAKVSSMRAYLHTMFMSAAALVVTADAAFAGFTAAVPGPIAAVGAPALLVISGAFLAVRYLRSRRK
jgi:hypothetical protein